ncbi:hypothetical protein BV898_19602 [Hypsibius exemplaris]|uniref:DNA-directed DNA polymerase n=1 Tax=Hypsibius exemplaris TaxID=2072580 RepID=A0A9X6NL71_HYPEX|nr:hypothetical protein BV898_19602 [Hypsibius exemplaris]
MSHEQFNLADNFSVRVERAKLVGGACIPGDGDLISQQVKSLRCVFQIKNEDNFCMARALVVAKAHADIDESTPELRKEGMKAYKKLGQATGPMRGSQKKAALELVRLAGITDMKGPYTLADLPKFEAVLPGYQITVLNFANGKGIIYKSEATGKPLMLLQRNNHFDVCTSIAPFFGRSYWCHNCDKGYDQRTLHRCQFMCQMCLRQDCPKEMDSLIFCTSCLREFPGQSCFVHHLATTEGGSKNNGTEIPSLCSQNKRCPNCRMTFSLQHREEGAKHQCGETFCKNCKIHVIPGDHQCYIMPINFSPAQRKKHRETEFLYFDLETFTSADGTLIPNLAVVQNGFVNAVLPKTNEPIEETSRDELCKFLISPQCHNCLTNFILKWCLANGIIPQKQIINGTKIMQMDICNPTLGINLRIHCSYRQIPLKLFDFPAALELKDDKTYFDQWYAGEKQAKDGRYDFNAELRDYCKRDVDVLRDGCQKWREIFMEISGGICPFNAGLTIASLCSVIWRLKFLV